MVFNVIVYGFVALIAGAFAWLIIKPKKAAQQMTPMVQPQPMQPIVQYARPHADSEIDRKLLRIQRALQQKYEAKADAAAIAEAYELLGEES